MSFFTAFGDELVKVAKLSGLTKALLFGGGAAGAALAAKKALAYRDRPRTKKGGGDYGSGKDNWAEKLLSESTPEKKQPSLRELMLAKAKAAAKPKPARPTYKPKKRLYDVQTSPRYKYKSGAKK